MVSENLGKMKSGPIKPNEPLKKTDVKKSFLSNKGMAFQSTPIRTPFKACSVNVGSLIYSDQRPKTEQTIDYTAIEFTKPSSKYGIIYFNTYLT